MQNNQNKKEMVNHPSHYNMGNPAYEPYKVIGEWGCNFNIGNAIKYLARYKQKWNPVEDLEKAKKYIDFEIERLKNTESPEPDGDVAYAFDGVEEEPENPSWDACEPNDKGCDRATRVEVMKTALGMDDDEIADVVELDEPRKRPAARKFGKYFTPNPF